MYKAKKNHFQIIWRVVRLMTSVTHNLHSFREMFHENCENSSFHKSLIICPIFITFHSPAFILLPFSFKLT